MQISVIGAGGWGTTLGNLLAKKGYSVKIWALETDVIFSINDTHENAQFLPGFPLSKNLVAYSDFKSIVPEADIVVFAIPSAYVRKTAEKIKGYFRKDREYKLVSVSKGLEPGTFKLMSEILREILPRNVKIAALSGPNLSTEVAQEKPTATVIASVQMEILKELLEVFRTDYFKPYALSDERGIEICGAVKNITAIAVGICDGLRMGDNSKASIMTLGLTEMHRIGKQFGCQLRTFFGVAGVGDLIATCSSEYSRNHSFGRKLAEGKSFAQIKEEMHGQVAEGVWAAKSVHFFGEQKEISLPLTSQIYRIIHENKPMNTAMKDLLLLM